MIFVQNAVPPNLSVCDPAPNVTFHRADGSALRLSELRSQIVVIEFTSWNCPPCRALAPKLKQFATKYKDVKFLVVSTDPPSDVAKLLASREKDDPTVFVHDSYHSDRSKMAVWKFDNAAVPTMFVIGKGGRMASRAMTGDDQLPHLAERIAWAKIHPLATSQCQP